MTVEQKKLILGFIEMSETNKEFKELETDIKNQVGEIIELLPSDSIKKGLKLENELSKLIDLLKWSFFSFGVSAEQTINNKELDTKTNDF